MSELQNNARQQVSPNQTIIINQQSEKKSNGVGAAGFVIALIGIYLFWVPDAGWILWLLGFIFSFAGVFKKPGGLAIAGLVISLLVLIVIAVIDATFSFIVVIKSLWSEKNTEERILFFAVEAIVVAVAAVVGIFTGWLTRTLGGWKMTIGRGLLASIAGGIIGCGAGFFICYIYDEIQKERIEFDPIRGSLDHAYTSLQYAKAYSSAMNSLAMLFFFCVFGTIVGAILGNMIAKAAQSKRS
ncbi:hypothetical protein FACS189438_2960 [Bacteroidia bacterium]|nr:hypothetical protein FACS189438_2960 [Bacteroidia bacterium]